MSEVSVEMDYQVGRGSLRITTDTFEVTKDELFESFIRGYMAVCYAAGYVLSEDDLEELYKLIS